MCIYTEIIGGGPMLEMQAAALAAVILSIVFWVFLYGKQKVGLGQYAVPITLWIVFGTLDILITVKGTFWDPSCEGNPLTRAMLDWFGFYGPAVASVLWIALWAGIVLIVNKKISDSKIAGFLSLAIFYSLAAGHLYGFSSWFQPLCAVSRAVGTASNILPAVLSGIVLSAAHCLAKKK